MKEENKKCWSCGKYKAFYTKGYCYFDKEKIGHCIQHNKIVSNHECCEMWRYDQMMRNIRKRVALRSLTEILGRLTVIEQIMKEENELDKIKYELEKSLR